MKFLIVACLLAAVAAQEGEITEAERKDCVDVYLEGGNITARCSEVLKYLKDQYFGFIYGDANSWRIVHCIDDYLAKYKYFDFFLQADREFGDKTPTVEEQMELLTIRSAPLSLCRRSNGFEGLFKEFLEEGKLRRGEKRYQCVYKWAIERKILSKLEFDFDTSAFDPLDCAEFFKQFDVEFKGNEIGQLKSPSKFKLCVEKESAEYFMYRDMEIFMSITMFDLSEKQKEMFKLLYWLWFSGEDRIVMECVRDAYKKE